MDDNELDSPRHFYIDYNERDVTIELLSYNYVDYHVYYNN